SAALQRRRVHVSRRRAHRCGRHHRPDPHAVSARYFRRRRVVATDDPDARREPIVSQDVAVAEDIVSDGLDPQRSTDTRSALQRERDDLYDRLLRATAEFDNYRKRVERERRDLVEAASNDLVRDLLPAIDDFDRALAVAPAGDPMRRGVELIHRRLLDALKARGVEPFDSVGQIFDPMWHEGVATEPAHGRPDGMIVAELRRGYRANGKLLRPAQVKVAQS